MGERASSGFRVVIVGGGVAGLTLANALDVCCPSFFTLVFLLLIISVKC
jgi:cation diffusion facilitator CzcD-associated flavoprotein CzcO